MDNETTVEEPFWGLMPGETRTLPADFLEQEIDKIRHDLSILAEKYGPKCMILCRDGRRYVHRPNEIHNDAENDF